MMLSLLIAVLACATLPLILARLHNKIRKVVYSGPAMPITAGLEDLGRRTNTKYCWFMVGKEMYLAELSPSSYQKIRTNESANITVVRYLGKPQVESIQFSGEPHAEAVVTLGSEAMFLAATYFLAALAAMFAAMQVPAIAPAAFYASAFFFALTGFSLTMLQPRKDELKDMSVRIAGLKLGSGVTPVVVTLILTLALTFACFTWISIFTLFPGIHAAFAVGSIGALLLKSRQTM